MIPHRMSSFGERHSQRQRPIIHVAKDTPFSLLLEPVDPLPVPDLNAELIREGFVDPDEFGASESTTRNLRATPPSSPTSDLPAQLPGREPPTSQPPPNSPAYSPAYEPPTASSPVVAGTKRRHEDVVNSNDEAAGETGGVAPRKKVKLRLLGPKIIDLTDSPAGRKRGREEEGGDGVDGEEDGSRHRKKAKIHHSRPSTLGHPEIIDLTESAPTTPAAPSIEQSTHLARETIEHRIHTPIFAPSWSPITPPPRPLPTTTARDVPNASYSPQAPPWSPITPPLPQNPTPPTAETLRDGLMPPERLLMLTYGEDGGQRDMEEWDELLAWVGFRGPCRLPGLKELGLDELYQLGDMERYRAIAAWQEEEARRREEQGRGEEVGNSSEAETQIPWEVVGGSVDFLGILL